MKTRTHFTIIIGLLIFALVFPAASKAQDKRPLTHQDYDSWKSLGSSTISPDGNWILYLETPQKGEADLVVVNIKTGKEFRHAVGFTGEGTTAHRAAGSQFSFDSTHVVFLISPSETEIKEAKKEKEKEKEKENNQDQMRGGGNDSTAPKKKLGIMSLATGEVTLIEMVKDFKMPEEASGWLAYLKEEEKKEEPKDKKAAAKKPPEKKAVEAKPEEEKEEEEEKKEEKKKDYGTDLILHSLKYAQEGTIKSVLFYQFTKNGKFLFYTTSDKDKPETDGLYRLELGKDSSPLLIGLGNYKRFALNENETRLAFLTDRDDYEADEPAFNLYGMNIGDSQADLWVSHTSTANFPKGMAVSDKSDISFSTDGKIALFGIKEIPEPKKDEDEDEEEKAKFDLWHWNDPYPQPQQKLMVTSVNNNTWESVYYVDDKKFVKLADVDLPDVSLIDNGLIAWGQSIEPYTKMVSHFGSFYDIYLVEPKTGERTLVKNKLFGRARISPSGKYMMWFEDADWYVYDVLKKTTKNITESIDIRFDREDHDSPTPVGAHGIAGWTNNDASILIYDKYDIWEIKPDGSGARMITEGYGRNNDLSFRYLTLDPDEKTIDPKKSLLLRVTNTETMASGFSIDQVSGTKTPEKLLFEDRSFSSPRKAESADVVFFTRSSFEEFPDVWVSDTKFSNPKKITNLGIQTEPFIWGKAELRNFQSSDGKPLKGILLKPENFDPNKKYPLMVYIYETLHTGYHSFRNPSPGTSINTSYYVSNGYIVWQPDIEYDTGYPGQDALKCVLPGIQMLIGEGFVDPEAIGIQGHSWGGYQIAYMITQTNIFKAVEAGAPVSNMTSAYGGIRWASGMVRQFQYEHTQSRIGATLWEAPMRYFENSPIFWADKVQTPLLMIHNDEDGAVPWYQGIEYIMALRRLNKEAYMFNYNGEAHGLRKRVNMEDFTIRMQEFFDHHLKGAPAP
ncbi:MAG: prolyl oligopeptidase family serine peptidase, partial [Candidatus Aminicenantes bacterium]|nr:prolyl oligopeptidase family serine peptidase [Candidatus Aminicenantes bacterium]